MSGDKETEELGMLASALAGRPLAVAVTDGPAWTDGATVYVDGASSGWDRLESLVVQASLLAAGGLEPDIVRRLGHRRGAIERYLAIEGRRALRANEPLLPIAWRFHPDTPWPGADSPTASLALAQGREPIQKPPANFGTIRPAALLAVRRAAEKSAAATRHAPRRRSADDLADVTEDADENAVADPFSSPVGGGGALGKLLARLLSPMRSRGGGGPPGADAPTHSRRSATHGTGAVGSALRPAADNEDGGPATGIRYPEWDAERRSYRPDWCTVVETEARELEVAWIDPGGHALRRPLVRIGLGASRHHRQRQGDDIDIDAAVEARIATAAGRTCDDAVYIDDLRRRRDLSVLILLDISGSTAEAGPAGRTVHEHQRSVTAALVGALSELGDRVAVSAYSSRGRGAVHLATVKRFDDSFDAAVLRRLYGLEPGAYSRLGAAIRHGTAILCRHGGTPRRLLVVVSDGLAYDHGYERAHGAADARKALSEAGRVGVGCVCLTVGAALDAAELQRVFGTAAHATIATTEHLSRVVGPLFRVALHRAESAGRSRT